jgi:5-deoxy-glucuronate isomerase
LQLHFKHRDFTGLLEVINPENSPSEELELALVRASSGQSIERIYEGKESVLVILGGRCSVSIDGLGAWDNLGERKSVFDGQATAVYIPPGVRHRVSTDGFVEVAVFRAPAHRGGEEAYLVRPEEVQAVDRGRDNWRREVHDIIDETRPAKKLIVGETFNDPGAWSSYPPHKHDVQDSPREVRLQEIYHYRVQPESGFGLQRLYSPERSFDETFTVQDGDSFLVPFGYHPVVAAAGYQLYYLWALSGESRALHPREDPVHSWISGGV